MKGGDCFWNQCPVHYLYPCVGAHEYAKEIFNPVGRTPFFNLIRVKLSWHGRLASPKFTGLRSALFLYLSHGGSFSARDVGLRLALPSESGQVMWRRESLSAGVFGPGGLSRPHGRRGSWQLDCTFGHSRFQNTGGYPLVDVEWDNCSRSVER